MPKITEVQKPEYIYKYNVKNHRSPETRIYTNTMSKITEVQKPELTLWIYKYNVKITEVQKPE